MNPVFAADSGRVRLDPTTFEALCRVADPPSRSAAALAAVQQPIASLQLLITGSAGYQLHQGWLSVVSAVLADVGDGSYDFAAIGTEFVPTLVARMTRLGLRPHLEPATVAVTEAVLDGLVSHETGPRAEAAQALVAATASTWPAWAAAAQAGDWRFWVADVTWPAPAGEAASDEAGRRLAVLDTGAGLVRVDGDESGPRLVAVTPTEVWRLLSGILPADDDLAAAALS